jgi:hypothetical protein
MIPSFTFNLPDPEHSSLARAVLVLGYLAAALCWLKAGWRARAAREKYSERWWLLGAFLLFFLATNKAFDFRTQCEAFLRMAAKATGWYERRQPVQFVLAILLPVVAGLFVLTFLWTHARQFVREHPLALPGWFLLFLYLALREALEWKPALDWLTSLKYFQWRLGLELAGVGLTALAAVAAWKKQTPIL